MRSALHIIVTLAFAYITYQIVYKVIKTFMLNGRNYSDRILVGLVFPSAMDNNHQIIWNDQF
jgi:hypothetical protein